MIILLSLKKKKKKERCEQCGFIYFILNSKDCAKLCLDFPLKTNK